MKYLLLAFIIYIAYRFVFNFLIPVIITTRQVKKGFREMHEKMEQAQSPGPEPPKASTKPSEEDYIEYEEVK